MPIRKRTKGIGWTLSSVNWGAGGCWPSREAAAFADSFPHSRGWNPERTGHLPGSPVRPPVPDCWRHRRGRSFTIATCQSHQVWAGRKPGEAWDADWLFCKSSWSCPSPRWYNSQEQRRASLSPQVPPHSPHWSVCSLSPPGKHSTMWVQQPWGPQQAVWGPQDSALM